MDMKLLAAQLRKPEGKTGIEVGIVMNKGNELINLWTISELHLQPYDLVLEIGMGNGLFVKDVLAAYPSVQYTGCDYSDTMVEEAIRMNVNYIEKGHASFEMCTADNLPYADNSFSKVFTVNTIYFWAEAKKELAEIRRVLKNDGLFVISVRTKDTMDQMPFTGFGFEKYTLEELKALLQKNGFGVISSYQKKEPVYEFNGQQMSLENIVVSCRPAIH
jgi:ubiquinone/menaquinone biosynthesis C-methylase UbiE